MSDDADRRPPQGRADPPLAGLPPRFSWPMRIFLGFLLLDIVFHSYVAVTPYREWCEELGIETTPAKGLPSPEKCRELEASASDTDPTPVEDRVWEAFDSAWDFFKPWPSAQTRRKMNGWPDRGKYVVCWLTTRLDFLNNLIRFDQSWPMFSPNVGTWDFYIRVELVYEMPDRLGLLAGGLGRVHEEVSKEYVSNVAYPEDLTRYQSLRFFTEKVLQYETKLEKDYEARYGYFNLIATRRRSNDRGWRLKSIFIYKKVVEYPKPGEDPVSILRAQQGPAFWKDVSPDWEYEVKRRKVWRLKD